MDYATVTVAEMDFKSLLLECHIVIPKQQKFIQSLLVIYSRTREHERTLLEEAKDYTSELERQKIEIEKGDNFPESSNSEVSKLRQQLLKYNNDLAQTDERQYQLEYKLDCLHEEKSMVQKEYDRMPKQGVSSHSRLYVSFMF